MSHPHIDPLCSPSGRALSTPSPRGRVWPKTMRPRALSTPPSPPPFECTLIQLRSAGHARMHEFSVAVGHERPALASRRARRARGGPWPSAAAAAGHPPPGGRARAGPECPASGARDVLANVGVLIAAGVTCPACPGHLWALGVSWASLPWVSWGSRYCRGNVRHPWDDIQDN